MATPALRSVLFSVLVPGTVGGWMPVLVGLVTDADRPPGPLRVIVAVLLGLPGLGLYVWTVLDFVRRGRGTPGPWDPPRRLVVGGAYRVSRNPMYVGVILVVSAWAVLLGSFGVAVYGVVVFAAFNAFILGYEERTLGRLFGEEYAAYRRRVRRWL